ncbi:MAG TPA: phosphoribosylamine--glycine ligase [Chroococcales cyanobacterium]
MLNLPEHKLNLLVIGAGGREHALVWKLAQSPAVGSILCAPGNGGTAGASKAKNIAVLNRAEDFAALAETCKSEKIDLVVVGPDNPLAEGIVDYLTAHGIRTFGPTKEQAKLEWSKAHAKRFMKRIGLPTARYAEFDNLDDALNTVREYDWARVIKVDGLALGKGVFVCDSEEEAETALRTIFEDKTFGDAGHKVVIEEKLVGEEISLLMLVDGKTLKVLEPCQDHKRRFDGDRGPNTGGMGAYSPVDAFKDLDAVIEKTIIMPLKRALEEGTLDFKGVLYAGLLIGASETSGNVGRVRTPYVLEFNARFGDPETQALMPRLDCDLLPLLWACTSGQLSETELKWSADKSCCVVAVADKYPAASANSKDQPISISALPDRCVLFHAGTRAEAGKVYTNGGRVLSIVALAPSMEAASELAYKGLQSVSFNGLEFRRDIARRAFKACLSS